MQIVLCELRNNSTVFEELEVSIVDLTVSNAVLLETRSGARKMDICDQSNPQLKPTTLQIQYCYSYFYEIRTTCTH